MIEIKNALKQLGVTGKVKIKRHNSFILKVCKWQTVWLMGYGKKYFRGVIIKIRQA